MMIDVTVSDGDVDLVQLYTHMNPVAAGATLTFHSHERLVFAVGEDQFVVTGTNLAWRDGALQGGLVDSLSFRSGGDNLVTFASLQTTGVALWTAMQLESAPTALTELLVHHCWTYEGSEGVDYFPETTLDPFGTLDPRGNDKVRLNGGDDVFFTGGSRDTVLGGTGNDLLYGGTENDRLAGCSGNDSLYGDSQNDLLEGGAGRDRLWGGYGNDVLSGGTGDDKLRGGAGADLFVFVAGSGQDVITDYEVGVDHLQIDQSVTIVDLGADIAVQFGLDTVLLLGVTVDQLTLADFILPAQPI